MTIVIARVASPSNASFRGLRFIADQPFVVYLPISPGPCDSNVGANEEGAAEPGGETRRDGRINEGAPPPQIAARDRGRMGPGPHGTGAEWHGGPAGCDIR